MPLFSVPFMLFVPIVQIALAAKYRQIFRKKNVETGISVLEFDEIKNEKVIYNSIRKLF